MPQEREGLRIKLNNAFNNRIDLIKRSIPIIKGGMFDERKRCLFNLNTPLASKGEIVLLRIGRVFIMGELEVDMALAKLGAMATGGRKNSL